MSSAQAKAQFRINQLELSLLNSNWLKLETPVYTEDTVIGVLRYGRQAYFS
jgi:hypothetical protein